MTDPIEDRSVLVTGGAGFIGSEIVRQLLNNGNEVTVVDNFVTGVIENIQDVISDGNHDLDRDCIQIISGDLRTTNLTSILETHDIDCVFHLAAEPYIPSCYDRPDDFFSVNANGTLKLLLACDEANVDKVLYYSSSEIYGTAQEVPMDEHHRTFPQSTYAVSKLAADRLCFTLHHERNLPIVILRQFNCYGPRETHPYIVPEIIAQLSESNQVDLGNINASRDLTYVSDAARGALKLANVPESNGEVVNLGYGTDFTVEELAYKIGKIMGYADIEISIEQERFRPLDVQQLQCDYSKAKELVGYEPSTTLDEGLTRTIEWYETNGPWPWEVTLKDQLWEAE